MPKVHAGTPLGMGYAQTQFASPDKSFQLVYIARDLVTGIAETIIRDRFEGQADRTLHASEIGDWAASTVSVKSPLILVDLRTTGLLKLGVTTDAAHAKAQEAGRLLSQELVLKRSPLTASCIFLASLGRNAWRFMIAR